MPPRLSIVVPAYNEAARLGGSLQEIIRYLNDTRESSEVIVVDDGSTDETAEIARQVLQDSGVVSTRVVRYEENRGKGYAVRLGLLEAQANIALFSDADLSTPLEETPKLIEPIADGKIDIAFGSRALDRSLIGQHQPWRREQAGRIFNLLVRLATNLPFWDTQCGFKAFRVDVCRPIFEAARIDGFAFDVELLYLAQRAGLRICEIPVRWNDAEGSKVRFLQDSLRMLREVIALRTRRSF